MRLKICAFSPAWRWNQDIPSSTRIFSSTLRHWFPICAQKHSENWDSGRAFHLKLSRIFTASVHLCTCHLDNLRPWTFPDRTPYAESASLWRWTPMSWPSPFAAEVSDVRTEQRLYGGVQHKIHQTLSILTMRLPSQEWSQIEKENHCQYAKNSSESAQISPDEALAKGPVDTWQQYCCY